MPAHVDTRSAMYGISSNPYIAGNPVGGEHFFGREDLLAAIVTDLGTPGVTAVTVSGQRRVGKTSILTWLRDSLPRDHYAPVLFDLQGKQDQTMAEVLAHLTEVLIYGLNLPLDIPQEKLAEPAEATFTGEVLPVALAQVGPGRRLLLLLDEFDVLDPDVQRSPFADSAANRLFGFLSDLSANYEQLQFVFVVGRRMESLSVLLQPILRASKNHIVSFLLPADAERLVRKAARDGSLAFAPGVVEHILALTSGHPNATQALCQTLWIQATGGHASRPAPADVAAVEAAAQEVLERNASQFSDLWDSLAADERIVLAAIAAGGPAGRGVGERVSAYVQEHGLAAPLKQIPLEQTLSRLYSWGVIAAESGEPRLAVELFRRFIVQAKPWFTVKDELMKLDNRAAELYQFAGRSYREGRLEEARDFLRRTLEADESYVNARVLLARIAWDEGQLEQAIAELKRARAINRGAEGMLTEVLLARAAQLERASDGEAARAVYEEVLSFARRNPTALERSRHFDEAVERGDSLKLQGRLLEAFAAYKEVAARAHIEALQRHAIDARHAEAETLASAGRWPEAAAAYAWLAGNDQSRTGQWQQRRAAALVEERLEMLAAFEQADEWPLALSRYQQIARDFPALDPALGTRVTSGMQVARLFAEQPIRLELAREVLGRLEPPLLLALIDRLVQNLGHRPTLEVLVAATRRLHAIVVPRDGQPEAVQPAGRLATERYLQDNAELFQLKLNRLLAVAHERPKAILPEVIALVRDHPLLVGGPERLLALHTEVFPERPPSRQPDPTPLSTRATVAARRPAPALTGAPARPRAAPQLDPSAFADILRWLGVLAVAALVAFGCPWLISAYGLVRTIEIGLMIPTLLCLIVLLLVAIGVARSWGR